MHHTAAHPKPDADELSLSSAELLPIVYDELRRLAAFRLSGNSSKTFQPTELVHEAWLRLSVTHEKLWQSRDHYFNAAALAMRRILVDRVRERTRKKKKESDAAAEEADDGLAGDDAHILLIHDCLTRLEKNDPYSAKVVLLKFYGGLSSEEIAEITGRSVRSVERQWMFAKAKLYRFIEENRRCG